MSACIGSTLQRFRISFGGQGGGVGVDCLLTKQSYSSLCWAAVADSVLYLYEGDRENRWCEIVLAAAPANTTMAGLPACLAGGECNRTQELSGRLQDAGILFDEIGPNNVRDFCSAIREGRVVAVARDVPESENHAILLLGFIETPVSVIYFDPENASVGKFPFGELGPGDRLFITGRNDAPSALGKSFDAYSFVQQLRGAQAVLGEGSWVGVDLFSEVLRIPGGERAIRTLRRFFAAEGDAERKLDNLEVSDGIQLVRVNWRQLAEFGDLDSECWWAELERLGGLADSQRVESRHLSFREGQFLGTFDCVDVDGKFNGRQANSGWGARSFVNALASARGEVELVGKKLRSIWLLEITGLRFSAIIVATTAFKSDKIFPLAKGFGHDSDSLDRYDVQRMINARLSDDR